MTYALVAPILILVVVLSMLILSWKDKDLLWFMFFSSMSVGLAIAYRGFNFMPRLVSHMLRRLVFSAILLAPIASLRGFINGAPRIGWPMVALIVGYLYLALLALLVLSARLELEMISKERTEKELKRTVHISGFLIGIPLGMAFIAAFG